jgi:hypothetical protein
MDQRGFVLSFRRERDAMLASYVAPVPDTYVGRLLHEAQLDDTQREKVVEALGTAITDVLYTVLLGLDGCAAIGGTQQAYRIADESGAIISTGKGGELEELAFELLQQR